MARFRSMVSNNRTLAVIVALGILIMIAWIGARLVWGSWMVIGP